MRKEPIQGRNSLGDPEEKEHWVLTRREGSTDGCPRGPPQGARVRALRAPKTNQRPAALAAVRALRRRQVGNGPNIETTAAPTSDGSLTGICHNRHVAPPSPPPAASLQSIRCRARSRHTAAAHHWPLPSAAHYAVREVDNKADIPESVDPQGEARVITSTLPVRPQFFATGPMCGLNLTPCGKKTYSCAPEPHMM